jgi:hypothetical protein
MKVRLLSKYTGISKWKIKRHLQPEKFAALKDSVLQKYAEILRTTVDDLKEANPQVK